MKAEKQNIKVLKELRSKLINAKKIQNKTNSDIINFYENSLKIRNVLDGMVIIIGDTFIEKKIAPGKISHEKIVQEIFDNLDVEQTDFSKVSGDFGEEIPLKYGYIFIRMSSILNGPTIVYYPEVCNEYQLEQLIKINNEIKQFNSSKSTDYNIMFEYNGKSGDISNNLDEIIDKLKTRLEHDSFIKK